MAYQVSGHLNKDGSPYSGTLYVTHSLNGSLLATATSSGVDGSWSAAVPDATPVYVWTPSPATGYTPLIDGPYTPDTV